MVPLIGGLGSIWGPPEGKDYKWYISGIFPAKWVITYRRSHLLRQPDAAIDFWRPNQRILLKKQRLGS